MVRITPSDLEPYLAGLFEASRPWASSRTPRPLAALTLALRFDSSVSSDRRTAVVLTRLAERRLFVAMQQETSS
jgi:hypothetical protein